MDKYSNMPLIFGIGYKARFGKDTVANFIKEEFGHQYNIQILPFAGPLKREINECAEKSGGMIKLFSPGLRAENFGGYWDPIKQDVIPLPDWVQYDPEAPMDDPLCPYGKQRTLLQWWGTQYRRTSDPDHWVKKNAELIQKSGADIVFIPDTRYSNEVAFCKEYGEVIRIDRPNFDNGVGNHISEIALDYMKDEDWSAVILNDGTLEDLRYRAVLVFESLMEKVQRGTGVPM